jgi:hypothetical protein
LIGSVIRIVKSTSASLQAQNPAVFGDGGPEGREFGSGDLQSGNSQVTGLGGEREITQTAYDPPAITSTATGSGIVYDSITTAGILGIGVSSIQAVASVIKFTQIRVVTGIEDTVTIISEDQQSIIVNTGIEDDINIVLKDHTILLKTGS